MPQMGIERQNSRRHPKRRARARPSRPEGPDAEHSGTSARVPPRARLPHGLGPAQRRQWNVDLRCPECEWRGGGSYTSRWSTASTRSSTVGTGVWSRTSARSRGRTWRKRPTASRRARQRQHPPRRLLGRTARSAEYTPKRHLAPEERRPMARRRAPTRASSKTPLGDSCREQLPLVQRSRVESPFAARDPVRRGRDLVEGARGRDPVADPSAAEAGSRPPRSSSASEDPAGQDQRQGHGAVEQVGAARLAGALGRAGHVEDVVEELEGEPDLPRRSGSAPCRGRVPRRPSRQADSKRRASSASSAAGSAPREIEDVEGIAPLGELAERERDRRSEAARPGRSLATVAELGEGAREEQVADPERRVATGTCDDRRPAAANRCPSRTSSWTSVAMWTSSIAVAARIAGSAAARPAAHQEHQHRPKSLAAAASRVDAPPHRPGSRRGPRPALAAAPRPPPSWRATRRRLRSGRPSPAAVRRSGSRSSRHPNPRGAQLGRLAEWIAMIPPASTRYRIRSNPPTAIRSASPAGEGKRFTDSGR